MDLGVPGALIAVPMSVTIILVCANVALLRQIAVLLGGGGPVQDAAALRG